MSCLVGKPVVIEDNAWIFPNVMVMPGVTIGKGAVVYPGSVVTRNVEAYSIVGGNPAKHLRFRNKNILYSADFPIWFAV
jgi:acetyltransferase-like isoleucine patch superfamily enzyme